MHFTSLIIACLLAYTPSILARKKDDAVLLSKVKSLTLRNDQFTSHRRIEASPQLKCEGGNGQGFYEVDVMRCHNSGSEYNAEDIAWTCKADLPPEFKLGSTDVICEGYDSAEDPFVLKGSCGVEYRLILTDLGEKKYINHVNDYARKTSQSKKPLPKKETGGSDHPDVLSRWLFWLIFSAIVVVILYSIFFPSRGNGANPGNDRRRGWGTGFGGGGGGGYDDGHDDPPPPYQPRAKPYSSRSSRKSGGGQQGQYQPGFWSGTAAGAAAGYAASSYANRQQAPRPASSNWFGGGGGSSSNAPRYGGLSSFGAGPSSSAPTPSSSRQESTGFGGTRRR